MTREEAVEVLRNTEDNINYDTKREEIYFTHKWVGAYEMAIAALREQPRWISVDERLPEPFVSVLVYMPDERPLPPVHEGFLAREGMWYANHFDREPMEITHWMPLPEPPEVEV